MSVRVSDGDVRAVVPNTALDCLKVFIITASAQVDVLAASGCGASLSPAILVEVERYLAAHYVAITDPSVCLQSEKVEGAAMVASRGVAGEGILSTQFGVMANTLSGGCLVESTLRKPTIGFF